MRIGQTVKWKSLNSDLWIYGVVTCFEADKDGWAIVGGTPVRRSRLVEVRWKKGKTAKGGGDDPAGTAALMAEVA